MFALQFYGECWTGVNAEKSYSEYGSSPNCWNGVGGLRTNFVYEFIDDDDDDDEVSLMRGLLLKSNRSG